MNSLGTRTANQEIVAIIPARGGSKGLPGKNIRLLLGKPLIAFSIEAALAAQEITRVVVSTDDAEIAAVAHAYGADVVDRPAALAGDKSTSEDALLHTLDVMYPEAGNQPEMFLFLQCTSPLTAASDLDELIAAMQRGGADSAFLASRFYHFLWCADDDGDFHGVNHDRSARQMRQDRPAEYLETGAAYAMKLAGFRTHRHRFFGKVIAVEMPEERLGEIDTLAEFEAIEHRLRANASVAISAGLPPAVSALIMDFDGVLTDDHVTVSQDGIESVRCSRSDGMGIDLLRRTGLPMIVLSRESNPVVRARCDKLKVDCVHGLETKLATLENWAREHDIDLGAAIYCGNDVNDLECMDRVGFAAAPADAHQSARDAADLILQHAGGKGAVRELCDLILRQK